MNINHEQVSHRQFGIGTIVNQTDSKIEVQFSDDYGTKKFIYPIAFEKYLTLCSSTLQRKMDNELLKMHERIEAEKKQREEEEQIRREEEHKASLEEKRATAKKRAPVKKSAAKTKEEGRR